jgi:hypothetical protein
MLHRAALVAGFGLGCAHRNIGVVPVLDPGAGPVQALAEGDAAWGRRSDEAALDRAMEAWTAAALRTPDAPDPWVRLAQGAWFRADGLADSDAARAAYAEAIRSADACEALDPTVHSARARGLPLAQQFEHASPVTLTCAYWGALARDDQAWRRAPSFGLQIAPEVEARMQAALDAIPAIDGGGPDRWWGAHLARLPAFHGGDLIGAGDHFDAAERQGPGRLAGYRARAESLAVASGDRDAFLADLAAVLAPTSPLAPGYDVENARDQARARALLARVDALFPPEQPP